MTDKETLQQVRKIVGVKGWENLGACGPKPGPPLVEIKPGTPPPGRSPQKIELWRVFCGEGRYKAEARNALFHRQSQVGLNFQIIGCEDLVQRYEFCLVWPDGWRLMYHRDPDRKDGHEHPEHHLQFEQPRGNLLPPPPFASWRPPFGTTDPLQILEYLVTQIR
jgi:hypothetical protein